MNFRLHTYLLDKGMKNMIFPTKCMSDECFIYILSLGVTHRPQVVIQVAAIIINLQQPHILWRMLKEPHQRCLPVQMSLPIQTV